MLVLPAVDVRGGRCVRLIQGEADSERVYDGDPVAAALRWEAALQVLWAVEEPGKPRPRPDRRADPARHDQLERAADEALEALRASADRRFFRLRRPD